MKKFTILLLLLITGVSFSQNLLDKPILREGTNSDNPTWGTDILISNYEPIGPIASAKLGNTIYVAINDTLVTTNLGIVIFKSTNNGANWTLHGTGIIIRNRLPRIIFVTSGAGPDSLYLFFQYQNTIYRWNIGNNSAFQILTSGAYRTFDAVGSSTGALYVFTDSLANNHIPRYASVDGGWTWPTRGLVTTSGAIPRLSKMVTGDTTILTYYNTSTIVGTDTATASIRSARYSQSSNGVLSSAYFQDVATETVPKHEFKAAMTKGNVWLIYTTGTTGNINIYGRKSTNAGQNYSATPIDVAVNPNVDEYWFDIDVFQVGVGGFDLVYYSDSLQSGPPTNSTDKLMYTYSNSNASNFSFVTHISNHPPGWSPADYRPVIVEIPTSDVGITWVGHDGTPKRVYWDRYYYVTRIKSENNFIAEKYSLEQNYPNPFNPVTTIKFEIPKSGFVSLKVYDILGKEIKTLVSENLTAGVYSVDFDASNLPSGIYFYTFESNGFKDTKKMILMK